MGIPFSSSPEEDGEDPSAVPEIQFNEEEGPEKKVRGGAFPPPMEIFGPRQQEESAEQNDAVREQGIAIITTLADFGIQAELADMIIGPTVIQFQIQLAPVIKVSRVSGLSNVLAVGLAVPAIRIEAPIREAYVGGAPNQRKAYPYGRFWSPRHGRTASSTCSSHGSPRTPAPWWWAEELPHLLVAGTTGSKERLRHELHYGALHPSHFGGAAAHPHRPERVELSIYENLPICSPNLWCRPRRPFRPWHGPSGRWSAAMKFLLWPGPQPEVLQPVGARNPRCPLSSSWWMNFDLMFTAQKDGGLHMQTGPDGPRHGNPPDPRHSAPR